MELDNMVAYMHMLLKHGMLCYFTDFYPMLPELKQWANMVLVMERRWPICHVKFVGKNFDLIIFKDVEHQTLALEAKPWFIARNFMYTICWDPAFDLSIWGYSPLPVWVELPYRVLSLEVGKIYLAKLLCQVLVYLNGDMHSSYPNNWLCVLWNLHREVLESGDEIWGGHHYLVTGAI